MRSVHVKDNDLSFWQKISSTIDSGVMFIYISLIKVHFSLFVCNRNCFWKRLQLQNMTVLCWIQSMSCPGINIWLLFFCVQLFLKCYILFTIYSGTILSTSIYSTQSIHNYLTWSMQFLGRKKMLIWVEIAVSAVMSAFIYGLYMVST